MARILMTMVFFISLCFYPLCTYGGVSLPWSCNFDNCSDWDQGQTLNCCGLDLGGGWTCNGTPEEINSTMPWGGTGKSQVHWAGPGDNINSSGLELILTSPQREVWIRYYVRYESGFYFSSFNYDKHLYVNRGDFGGNLAVIFEPNVGDYYRCVGGGVYKSLPGTGWNTVFSDYKWHWVEVHLRFGSSSGICEVWLDGSKIINYHGSLGSDSDRIAEVLFGSNQRTVGHSGCKARYFDNLAVQITGPIGPGSGGSAPSPPQNLTIE